MITANATIQSEIAKSACQPVELYEINAIRGSSILTLYYSKYNINISFNSITYYANGGISRTPIKQYLGLGYYEVTIELDNIKASAYNPLSYYSEIEGYEFRGQDLIIKKVFIGYLTISTNYVQRFQGTIDNLEFKNNKVIIKAKSWIHSLNTLVPKRTYKPICPWEFGPTECGYTKNINDSGTVTYAISSGRNTFFDRNKKYIDNSLKNGFIEFTSGNNIGQKRKIKENYYSTENGQSYGIYDSFKYYIKISDNYNLTLGCDKSITNCQQYNNTQNFGGFLAGVNKWSIKQRTI